MKLPFTASFELLGIDVEVMLSVEIEDDGCGNRSLSIDNVFEASGNFSLLHHERASHRELAGDIADMAEDDSALLARAVETADFEREAA